MAEDRCPTCGRRKTGRPKAQVPVRFILDRLARGEGPSEIARALGISRAAVYRVKAQGVGVPDHQGTEGVPWHVA